MRFGYKTALLATALMGFAAADAAYAQFASTYDPAQLPELKGKVAQYIPTPRGDVDGLLLTDGTEVQIGPAASTQLVFAVKPGDSVTAHGLKAKALPLFAAASITNDATGVTVLGGPPRAHQEAQVSVEGKVKAELHDMRGDTNGVLLDDGTVVRLPPPEARKLAAEIAVGKPLVVRGEGYAGPLGKAIGAREIGPDAAHLTKISGPGMGWRGWMHDHWEHEHGGPMHGPDGAGAPPPPAPAQ
jgi:hypothetical protein